MTIAKTSATNLAAERRFFWYMALAILVAAVAGFGSDVFARQVWFTDFPWPVHVHAIFFSSWIVLYVVQNWLAAYRRDFTAHRRLGWLGAGIATLMVPLGIAGTIGAIARGSVTGVFPLGLFLPMNVLGLIGFGALTLGAIRLRRFPEWHKRLMLCGTVLVIGPAFGRLQAMLPLGDLGPFAVVGAMLLYVFVGIVFDLSTRRRVHPGYWWGTATIMLVQLLSGPIGFSAPVGAFAGRLAG